MNYKNGRDVLPPSLLKELQKHIEGELIYIPKRSNERVGWGVNSGTRQMIERRNEEIFALHCQGHSIEYLKQAFHLSQESIRKVIFKKRSEHAEDASKQKVSARQ
ncbi:hypothetical protein BCV73_19985 [Paenibacillus sp. SSG-1]|uniref:Mor family transcriptional regulator n=2 Tax=Paenibacillus TaxID=44249 RepID=A0A839TK16_9BACL|nr:MULTISPECIES: CD3324 family protein [Paenibacillus]MBB3127126.1 Mor family transcriptional regulator [Paenibacillus rhizosphaerae]OXL85130.1 hypothetical protein BCV73_19985 [Paenibacillus sp. SSG-1]PQP91488.1 hypothetical protein CPT76_00005 [Paenibacillus sp. AR247]UYO07169.1 hypothetical protein K2F33_15710 [Paenibacillus sp. PSB04]GIO55823.1 hypothetical protein J21TS7_41410 [Paenibacillus cineris]